MTQNRYYHKYIKEMVDSEPVLDILRHRCAIGEISEAQFEEIKRVLGVKEEVRYAHQPGRVQAGVVYWPDRTA